MLAARNRAAILISKSLMGTSMSVRTKVLSLDTMNPNVKNIEYAVRGPIVARAAEIEKELKSGQKKPFNEVIKCNIGDCHAMGQPPLTFLRQVTALLADSSLFKSNLYPDDAKQRAARILDDCGGQSVGAYSHACGVSVIREDCAKYIESRDGGVPANSDDIFLSTGASEAVKSILELLSTGKEGRDQVGIMIPIPQYPLYTATISQYNLRAVPYYLNEADNWSLSIKELRRAYEEAAPSCRPRGLVVINPGNPTGQVLRREIIEEVLQFAKEKSLFVLADEVYQHNVYAEGAKFFSFKQVINSMGPKYGKEIELASFMSASKGYMGECGFRGGYCELANIDKDVQAMLYKQLSARLCPSVIGQGLMSVIANPPKPGEPSYESHEREKAKVLGDLAIKARMATETFNRIPGMQCNPVQGAMYAFPSLQLPEKLVDEAKAKGMEPDAFYCTALLEEKGICVVPGSGFGQRPGTYHFRMTILPTVEKLKIVMQAFKEFHEDFINRYK
ncbi:hypothetical protein BOX15_Mlig029561g2 [Macrostomum lignano]|uniref:Uncharacterized protein n=3 Tax=Macrostomum lignano TaxID=282301 RepID=A0A267E8A2_9PLAT|nr:hypothetical protein BOX15_Mlig029561g2 [Macrostomum lignano]